MAIIYTYPAATPVSGDLLIFSDISTEDPPNATRTCTVGDLVTLIGDLVPGGGTVQDVKLDLTDTGLLTSGLTAQTIETTGTFLIGGQLNQGYGGTGLTSYTKGDMLYAPDSEAVVALAKLGIGTEGQILVVGGVDIPEWQDPEDHPVTSVTAIAPATQTGTNPIIVTPTTGLVTVQSLTYDGGTKAGHVPGTSGGISTVYLNGVGTFSTPPDTNTTYLIMDDTDLGLGRLEDNTTQLTTANIVSAVASRTYGIQNNSSGQLVVNVPWEAGGDGIYSASGSLSGATIVTIGANDLTFTATTGDIIFNNNVAPNPAMMIDGATNSIGIGGNTTFADQLSVYNSTTTNTSAIGVYGLNTTGDQIGADIGMSGAATTNTALKLGSISATTNYALVTDGGNSGFGTVTPDPEAIVEIVSTTQGLLIPRWTTVQETANTGGWGSGEEGMTWFNTTTKKFMGWDGTISVILG